MIEAHEQASPVTRFLPESISKQWPLLVAMLLSLAPAWIPYSSRMWSAGHYQYFPVLIAVIAYLLYGRREALQTHATPAVTWLTGAGLSVVALLAAASHLLQSGFLGIVGTIVGCWTMVYACFGAGGLRQVWTVLLLLLFIVPLPLSLDQSLVVKMQFWASRLAAQFLDGLGIMHFRQGVILVTEKSQFLTEEACSGIRSLFSSLAFVAALSVMQHHHWARALFNLLQTVAWVILGNAIRVAAVVILADHVSTWFASGAGHELLGMAVFLFILIVVASTDALIGMLLFRPLVNDYELIEAERNAKAPSSLPHDGSASANAPSFPAGFRYGWIGALVLIGLLGGWTAIVRTGVLQQGIGAIAMPDMPLPAEDDLPALLGNGWQRTNFEHVHRDVNPILAQESYVYTYSRNGRGFVVSVDLPWSSWHDLNVCYSALGWESKPSYFVSRRQTGEGTTQSELKLTRPDKTGFVIFAVIDRQKQELLLPNWRMVAGGWKEFADSVFRQIAGSLGMADGSQSSLSEQQLPATTIQLMTESPEPLTERDYEEFRTLYDEIRKRLLAGQRWR